MSPKGTVVRVRWVVAVVVVVALLVAWVVVAEMDHRSVAKCAPGAVRIHEKCIQT
jgi:hypothetical protein